MEFSVIYWIRNNFLILCYVPDPMVERLEKEFEDSFLFFSSFCWPASVILIALRALTEDSKENTILFYIFLRTSEIHLYYNLLLFYWHFLEILWMFIFLVLYF
jgi:hypothetical protein